MLPTSHRGAEAAMQFEPGQHVTWTYQKPGDRSVEYVFATVRRVGPKRIQITAPLRAGGTKLVWVSPRRLAGGGSK